MKLGSDEGNTRAIIRFGRYLDKGVWFTLKSIRGWKFRRHLIRLWFIDIHF